MTTYDLFGGGLTVREELHDFITAAWDNYLQGNNFAIQAQEYCSVYNLVGLEGMFDGQGIQVSSFYRDVTDMDQPIGAGYFVWEKTKSKFRHNGVTIISPTVPWDGTQAGLSDFIAGTGETDPSGIGCWVRQDDHLDVMMGGALHDGSSDLVAFQAVVSSLPNSGSHVIRVPAGAYGGDLATLSLGNRKIVWLEEGDVSYSVSSPAGFRQPAAAVNVNGIADLQGFAGTAHSQRVEVASFYRWSAFNVRLRGGGTFFWDSSQAKSNHNGITIISPTVPWDGTISGLQSFFQRVGETDSSGTGCWVRKYGGLNIFMAGASGDGVADDTVPIKFALNHLFNRKLSLYFPTGTYLYDGSGELGAGNAIFGDGRYATTILSRLDSPTDGYLFRCQNTGSCIKSMGFSANVTQTGGSYVWMSGANTFIDDFYMTGDYNGILMSGNVSEIRNGRMQHGAAGSIRIRAEGGDNSQLIDNVTIGAQSPEIAAAGIRVRNSSALKIVNTNVLQQTIGLLIDPVSSTAGTSTTNTDSGNVFSLYVENSFFDTCANNGIRINPTGTGSVVRCRFANVWASSSGSDGVYINNAGSGSVGGMHFEDVHALFNAGSGLYTDGVLTDLQILGGEICQNNYGLYVNNTITGLSVTGATIGRGAGVLNGNTNNGIMLAPGASASDYITIVGNTMRGNGADAIVDNTTGTNKHIYGNPGSTYTYLQKINSLLDISGATGGQIKFPSSQNASSDVNTLDDYKEGTWTPSIAFATPGDSSIAYTSASGSYTKIGRLVTIRFQIVTSTFTHTTASGVLTVSGLPYTAAAGFNTPGSLTWSGITKAGYTQISPSVAAGAATIQLIASGSGVANAAIAAADMPTGGTVVLRGEVAYYV